MNKYLALALPVGLLLSSAPAFARAFSFSGNVCQPAQASAACTEYGQWGIGNTCTTQAITVECPLPMSTNLPAKSVTGATFFAFDRNSATGADVSCTLQRTGSDGAVLFSTPKASSGSKIDSYILSFPSIPQPQGVDFFWKAVCSVPAKTATGFSHLTGFALLTSE